MLLDELALREDMPLSVLETLCDAGRCLAALGHRSGPRSLLLRLVEQHAYPEAILTVALDLYQDVTVADDVFARFAQTHSNVSWMLRALASADASSRGKLTAYRDLLESDSAACCVHVAALACDQNASEFDEVLARFGTANVLRHVLQLDIDDSEKDRHLQARAAHVPELANVLQLYRQRRRARASDLSASEARYLLSTDDPRVLLALAKNRRTTSEVLQLLLERRHADLAGKIRSYALATLRSLQQANRK